MPVMGRFVAEVPLQFLPFTGKKVTLDIVDSSMCRELVHGGVSYLRVYPGFRTVMFYGKSSWGNRQTAKETRVHLALQKKPVFIACHGRGICREEGTVTRCETYSPVGSQPVSCIIFSPAKATAIRKKMINAQPFQEVKALRTSSQTAPACLSCSIGLWI